jgi:hypothetical protein
MPLCAPLLNVLRRGSWASGLKPSMLSAFAIRPGWDALATLISRSNAPRVAHTFCSIKDTARATLRHGVEDGLQPRRDLVLV